MKRTAVRHCLLWTLSGLLAACGGGDDRATAMSSAQAVATAQDGSPSRSRALATTSVVEATSSTLTTQAVNLQDAIAILKMIVGLEVNSSGQSVTAYQAYAADVDGNGKVELADAISVLKRVVGLETPTASWLFFNQSAGAPVLSDKLNPGLPANLTAAVSATTTSNVGLVAVLRGDVVGSSLTYAWALTSKPSSSSAVLTGATAASPTFTADLVGSYVATMTVSDGTNSASTAVTLTAAIPSVPGTPTIGAATAGDATASIAFTAGSTSDLTVTYTASCTATGATTITSSGTASPLSVTGLTNAKTYACTVTPASSAGTGSASAAVSVSPIAAVPSAPTIGTATAGSASASISFTAATAGSTATSFSVTCTPTSGTAVTVTGSSSPVSVTGLTNGTSYSCAVKSVGSGGSSLASSALSVTPVASSTVVTYSAPAPFVSVVTLAYAPSTALTRDTSAMTTRSRYMISDATAASTSSNYLSIGSTYSATTGYTVESGTISATSTYNNYLSKLVQAVAATDGYFRLDSHLHPNNSIDFDSSDSNKLKFRNNFGKATTTYGYVTFAYDTGTNLLRAKKRYTYTYSSTYVATYTLDSTFAAVDYYVNYTGGVYKLVAAVASATPLYLYSSPISLGIPTFMDPMKTSFATEGPAAFLNKVSSTTAVEAKIASEVNSTYSNQVSATGTNATTKTNADARLAIIKTTVEASGGTLRYAPALYTAFRDGLLANKLVSDSISDGTPGQNMVPYVYFTNEMDSSGVYHPFMVAINYGNQASPNGLKDVPSPPCSGSCGTAVTRFSNLENYITMIPMRNYGQVSAVTENTTFTTNLWSDVSGKLGSYTLDKNVYTYADVADNGVLIDGSVMFPMFNNTLVPSHLRGELSASGCHVGQGGGGPHCHADGYQSGQGLGLYNDADYVGKTHPPLIGFGYDGVALFGQYRSSDSALLGYGTALDDFGGHDHDSIGYHYHAHTVVDYQPVGLATTYKSTLHILMKGAYIGKIDTVPYFRSRTNNVLNSNKYMGGTVP